MANQAQVSRALTRGDDVIVRGPDGEVAGGD